MRYVTKVAIVTITLAVAVFATTYRVEFVKLREDGRQHRTTSVTEFREKVLRGEISAYCGPLPVHYATAYCLLAFFAVPIVLLTARGVWKLCARPSHDVPPTT
jgi:hypothetical protein